MECLEGQFLSSLGFCEPIEELVFTTFSTGAVADLFSAQGPTFTVVPGHPDRDPNYSLMVYYDPRGPRASEGTEDSAEEFLPRIGMGAVLANPLLKHGEPVATYLQLARWCMDPKAGPSGPMAFLVGLHKEGEVFIFPGSEDGVLVDPCTKLIKADQALPTDPPAYRVEFLRFFQLHHILVPQEGGGDVDQKLCFPRLNGGEARMIRARGEVMAQSAERHFTSSPGPVVVNVTPVDESHHWSLLEDTAYHELLVSQKAIATKRATKLEEATELTVAKRRRLEELSREKASKSLTASTQVVARVIDRLHSYRMQYLYEEGSVRILDRTLLHAFLQEFTRVNLLVWEDLGNEITTLVNNLGVKFDALVDYIKGTFPEELGSHSRSAIVGKVQQCRLEWATELLAFGVRTEGAKEEMEDFLKERLQEVGSQEETKELVSKLAERWTRLESAVRDVVLSKEMESPSVASRVGVAIAAGPAFQGNYVMGSLDAMLENLRLFSAEEDASPRSTSVAIAERQIDSLAQAFGDPERDFLTERLRPNYQEAFQQRCLKAVPKAFREPLLPGLIETMNRLRLETPGFQKPIRAPLSEEELLAEES
ncbi:MAG: hypothetical protein MJE68_19050, partial [Proteobacteria bacterium]|nr:hypothetical protein [Pseudomonadota bacterium]